MFLEYICACLDIIELTLSFIEDNSVLVGVITSVIVSSLWFKKYIQQKRAEAFFGFYTKLSLHLRSLKAILEENGQLNILNVESGNIYSLIYIEDCMKDTCPCYTEPGDKVLELLKKSAKELKDILFTTENNVYPSGVSRKDWYESQYNIIAFCDFIENETYWHITNVKINDDETVPKHTVKCKILIESMNFIIDSINNAKY